MTTVLWFAFLASVFFTGFCTAQAVAAYRWKRRPPRKMRAGWKHNFRRFNRVSRRLLAP